MMIKGIIFDFSGTVARNTKVMDHNKLSELLRESGYDIYNQEFEAAYRFVFFVEYPKGKINSYGDYFRRVLKLLGIKNPKKAVLDKIIGYAKQNDRYEFYPDVELVRNLEIKKAILTTIPLFRFSYLDLRGFYPVMTGKEIGRAKPHPKGFLKILEKWKLRPSEVLAVGNEADTDIIPAKELGMKTVFIDRKNAGEVTGGADYAISSLAELPEILKSEK